MIEIEANQLRIGMFIAQLDRPWLETSFLFQGFLIENEKQIERVGSLSKTVIVDEEKSLPSSLSEFIKASIERSETLPKTAKSNKNRFEAEISLANDTYIEASASLNKVLNDFRLNKYIAIPDVKTCVKNVIKNVTHNQNALLLLINMRSKRHDAVTHSINICIISALFGRFLNLQEEHLLQLSTAALLHDVGEIKVPESIFDKPNNTLTSEEKRLMERHTEYGAEMLGKTPDISAEIAEVAHSHHERLDGTGYPRGLKAEHISFMSKIVAIVDEYEKLTNCSDHKAQVCCSDALKSIYNLRTIYFDSELVEAFIKCLGVYPVGTIVQLSNRAIGIVVSVKPERHLLPTVMVIRDPHGEVKHPPQVINLDHFRDKDDKPLILINKVIPPMELDVDIGDYLTKELSFNLKL